MYYNEIFNPVVKPTTIWIVLSFTFSYNWHIYQLDVHNAFLNGLLMEDRYMAQPFGVFFQIMFADKRRHHMVSTTCWTLPNYVCRLKKTLYGLNLGLIPTFAKHFCQMEFSIFYCWFFHISFLEQEPYYDFTCLCWWHPPHRW